jgi:uncharacterized DUF497 family protein
MALPLAFEWDEDKAAQNYAKHGVPFEAAMDVFLDSARIEEPDDRKPYGEERVNVIGIVDGVCLNVTFTVRDGTYRIISARPASRRERRTYGYHP